MFNYTTEHVQIIASVNLWKFYDNQIAHSFYDFYSHNYWEVFCEIGVLKKQLVCNVVSSISSQSFWDITVKKFIFRIILLILLENELLYNFEEFLLQFLTQLSLRRLTGWFSICIHIYGVSSDLIPIASLKKPRNQM